MNDLSVVERAKLCGYRVQFDNEDRIRKIQIWIPSRKKWARVPFTRQPRGGVRFKVN